MSGPFLCAVAVIPHARTHPSFPIRAKGTLARLDLRLAFGHGRLAGKSQSGAERKADPVT